LKRGSALCSLKEAVMKQKIAIALQRQRDEHRRQRLIRLHVVGLVVLFVINGFLCRLDSPLKLIPITLIAMIMGYVFFMFVSLRQFKYVVDLIDWDKVAVAAESKGEDKNSKSEGSGRNVLPPPRPLEMSKAPLPDDELARTNESARQ